MKWIKQLFIKKTETKQCDIHSVRRTYAVSYHTKGCDGKSIQHTLHTLARSQEEANEKVNKLREQTS